MSMKNFFENPAGTVEIEKTFRGQRTKLIMSNLCLFIHKQIVGKSRKYWKTFNQIFFICILIKSTLINVIPYASAETMRRISRKHKTRGIVFFSSDMKPGDSTQPLDSRNLILYFI